jgi:hypothetical protein
MSLLLLSVTARTNELNVVQRRYQATDGLIPTLFNGAVSGSKFTLSRTR